MNRKSCVIRFISRWLWLKLLSVVLVTFSVNYDMECCIEANDCINW